jgi:hypothetical protein
MLDGELCDGSEFVFVQCACVQFAVDIGEITLLRSTCAEVFGTVMGMCRSQLLK